MSIIYFPPATTSENDAWLNNFYDNLQPIYRDYDITDQEIADLLADKNAYNYVTGRQEAYASTGSLFLVTRNVLWSGDPDNSNLASVNYENQVPEIKADEIPAQVRPNIYARLKSLVLRLRQHPKMTEATARLLGILPRPKSTEAPNDYLPVLSVSIANGQAVLDCPVKGFAGYEIWSDRTNNNDFSVRDKSMGRYWTDTQPLPDGVNAEIRQYKVRMLDTNNAPVGQFSNTVSAAVSRAI